MTSSSHGEARVAQDTHAHAGADATALAVQALNAGSGDPETLDSLTARLGLVCTVGAFKKEPAPFITARGAGLCYQWDLRGLSQEDRRRLVKMLLEAPL
jgi:hypothetical protein